MKSLHALAEEIYYAVEAVGSQFAAEAEIADLIRPLYQRIAKLERAQSTPCASCGYVLTRPVIGCGHVAGDGPCAHPSNMTPECHYDACPLIPPDPRPR